MTIVESDPHEPARAALEFAELGAFSDDAVAANQAVLDLDPENIDALLRMLHCRVDRSEFTQATALFERLDAVDLDQADRDDVGRLRADVLSRPRVFLRSRSDSSGALAGGWASVPEVSTVKEAQALAALYRELDRELAVAFLARALEIAKDPGHKVSVLAQLSSTYRDIPSKLAEALEACERAIEIEPSYEGNRAAYTSMVAVLRSLGRLDEAHRHGDELVERLPNDYFVLNAIGAVYRDLAVRDGDPTLARLATDYALRAADLGQAPKNAVARVRELLVAVRKLCELYSKDAARLAHLEAQKGRLEQHLVARL